VTFGASPGLGNLPTSDFREVFHAIANPDTLPTRDGQGARRLPVSLPVACLVGTRRRCNDARWAPDITEDDRT
jgi:hypothetical protein